MQVLPQIDPKDIPPDVEYQWIALEVMGDEKLGDAKRMFDLGWRPVPAERHWNAGFGRGLGAAQELEGGKVGWVVGGLLLAERDKTLQLRAKKEEREKADAQLGRAIKSGLNWLLPQDLRGIEEGRILPIASHHRVRDGWTATWTDKLTWSLWLAGWRYAAAKRYPEYQLFTKDPTKLRVLFFDRDQPRWLIERQGPAAGVRPAFDWYGFFRHRWWRK